MLKISVLLGLLMIMSSWAMLSLAQAVNEPEPVNERVNEGLDDGVNRATGYRPSHLKGAYKWLDPKGAIHYGQLPPRGIKDYTKVKPSYPNVPRINRIDNTADLDQSPKQETIKPGASNEEIKQQNCLTARENKALLQIPGTDLTYLNEAGQRVSIGQEEREQRLVEAQKDIDRFCK